MLKKEDRTPLYVRLAEEIEGAILRGEYRPGDKLPAERLLAQRYQASRHAVGQAMDYLHSKGLIHRERGRGTFVRPDRLDFRVSAEEFEFTEAIESLGMKASRKILSVRHVRARKQLAAKMNLEVGEIMAVVELLRYAERIPLRYGTGYLREALFPGIRGFLARGEWSLPALLRDHYGVEKYYRARSVFDVEPADLETSRHLRVPLGSPLLRVESLDTLEDGTSALLTISYFRADATRIWANFRPMRAIENVEGS